jgi:hypothetical protein
LNSKPLNQFKNLFLLAQNPLFSVQPIIPCRPSSSSARFTFFLDFIPAPACFLSDPAINSGPAGLVRPTGILAHHSPTVILLRPKQPPPLPVPPHHAPLSDALPCSVVEEVKRRSYRLRSPHQAAPNKLPSLSFWILK